jgi:hypothetical protein
MRKVKESTLPKAQDLRVEAVRTIISGMGITRAAFFIREAMSQPEDYLKIKQDLFGEKTAEEIYGEMKLMGR